MKIFLIILFVIIFLFVPAKKAEAKLLPQAKGAKAIVKSQGSSSGIIVSPHLRSNRRALAIYFSNLQNASSVSYTLMYNTNGQAEAAGGTISSSGNTATRELLFGTCSKNVCRYHTNISNARFEVTYVSTSGKKFLKRYRIKV